MPVSKPEVLHEKHLLEQFDCGNPTLNEWLLRHARQAQSSGSAKTFVVALNVSESPQQVHVTYEAQKSPKAVFGEASDISVDGRLRFTIPARSGVVLK